jgi:hypothetical protein
MTTSGAGLAAGAAMRSRAVVFLFLFFAVTACAGGSCSPQFEIDWVGPDECTPAGGSCFGLFCPADTHADGRTGCSLLAVCCSPGAPCEGRCAASCDDDEERGSGACLGGHVCCAPRFVPSPNFEDGAPITPPADAGPAMGFCNLLPCPAGCGCRARATDAGTCEELCDCADASPGAPPPDAASDAATDAASDGAADASTDDAATDGGPPACGVVRCEDGCTCFEPVTSECVCPAAGCSP